MYIDASEGVHTAHAWYVRVHRSKAHGTQFFARGAWSPELARRQETSLRACAVAKAMQEATEHASFKTFLYYWDGRDGPRWQGWWLSPDCVGSESFLAFSHGDARSPDLCREWQTGEGAIGMHVGSLGDGVVGVRAGGLGFEGAYELVRHAHEHDGRPVYCRARDLTETELPAMRGTTVVYSTQASLTDVPAGAVVGVPVSVDAQLTPFGAIDTGAVLNWVRGEPVAAAEEAEAAPVLHQSLRVETAADLELELSKGANQRVSLPGLADEDSPLPVGWVVAEQSAEAVTASVRSFLLRAASDLETALPDAVRRLPQVVELAARVRRLVEERGFFVCVWS